MRLKYRLGDFISIFVVILGVMLEIAQWPYGKNLTYAGFSLLGTVQLCYYSIDLRKGKAIFPDWKQILLPVFVLSCVAIHISSNMNTTYFLFGGLIFANPFKNKIDRQ